MNQPRYAPDFQLPPYAFVPGLAPHPRTHPEGHSFGRPDPEQIYVPSSQWQQNLAWLQGVDLYNLGYYWEAHEAWEFPWHASKEAEPDQALLLQALIQLAAAALKVPMNQPQGLLRLTETGTSKLRELAAKRPLFMGLDLHGTIAAFLDFAKDAFAPNPGPNPRRPPQIVLRLDSAETPC